MIPVDQTILDVPGGNCFQACLASLLECPIDQVPDFVNQHPPDGWLERLTDWALDQGLGVAYVSRLDSDAICNVVCPGPCILGVITDPPTSIEHPEWIHAVVGECRYGQRGRLEFKVLHDPLPNPRTITTIKDAVFLVKNVGQLHA